MMVSIPRRPAHLLSSALGSVGQLWTCKRSVCMTCQPAWHSVITPCLRDGMATANGAGPAPLDSCRRTLCRYSRPTGTAEGQPPLTLTSSEHVDGPVQAMLLQILRTVSSRSVKIVCTQTLHCNCAAYYFFTSLS